ncbi:MAG UNVERIFIED_CONTAM: hypothetical protein LVR29_16275 [Microcystis novacekii LVE1205-3]
MAFPLPSTRRNFADDLVFAYHYSYLPNYVEEKTKGKIKADDVERFLLANIRQGSLERLQKLKNNQCGVVDGESSSGS